MFRDRSNLFVSYRRTFPHSTGSVSSPSVTRPLGSPSKYDPFLVDDTNIELGNYPLLGEHEEGKNNDKMPPLFVDIARDIDTYLSEIDGLMERLVKLYRKNSLPGFEDKSHDEELIENLSLEVLQLFQRSYNVMKKLETISDEQFLEGRQLNRGELMLLGNMTKRYAEKIQWESNKFRVLQNNYLKYLNKDDLKPILPKKGEDTSQLLIAEEETKGKVAMEQELEQYSQQVLDQQMMKQRSGKTANQKFLQQRDEEITQLTRGVYEVSTIFREMQSLIIDQGTIIDRIDYNLENTSIQLKQAHSELQRATQYQKRSQKCKLILLLTLCVIALFFFVMLKPKHSTTSIAAPTDKPMVLPVSESSINEAALPTTSSNSIALEDILLEEVLEEPTLQQEERKVKPH